MVNLGGVATSVHDGGAHRSEDGRHQCDSGHLVVGHRGYVMNTIVTGAVARSRRHSVPCPAEEPPMGGRPICLMMVVIYDYI